MLFDIDTQSLRDSHGPLSQPEWTIWHFQVYDFLSSRTMAEVFTQAHIWADEKTSRTSRMNANECPNPWYKPRTSILVFRPSTLFIVRVKRLCKPTYVRDNSQSVLNDCLLLVNIELER